MQIGRKTETKVLRTTLKANRYISLYTKKCIIIRTTLLENAEAELIERKKK